MENITDSELLKIAENWAKEMPINTGIKTAFAAGYKMAERQAKNCTIPDVSGLACGNCGNPMEAIEGHYRWYCDNCNALY